MGYKNQIVRCSGCGNIVWQPQGDFFSKGGRGTPPRSSKSNPEIIDVEFEEKWILPSPQHSKAVYEMGYKVEKKKRGCNRSHLFTLWLIFNIILLLVCMASLILGLVLVGVYSICFSSVKCIYFLTLYQ